MRLRVVSIGGLKSKAIAELVDDYSKRLSHYLTFENIVLKNESALKVGRDDYLVVCDEHGAELTSKGLSEFIAKHQACGTKNLVFFIGDARGVGEEVQQKAKKTICLSRMTFTHEFARAILLEQLYRACTILRNEKYHYG